MIEDDTVKLLRECDAGAEMGVTSIDEVLGRVEHGELRRLLSECRDAHLGLKDEIRTQLRRCHDEGKSPAPMAKGMSWMKTNVMLGLKETDATVADLMTDGCNMGVKSLNRYLNRYAAADRSSRNIAARLIDLEHQLTVDIRGFL